MRNASPLAVFSSGVVILVESVLQPSSQRVLFALGVALLFAGIALLIVLRWLVWPQEAAAARAGQQGKTGP